MQRLLIVITLLLVITAGFALPASAQKHAAELSIYVNGLPVTLDIQPVIHNGRTLVPFRVIAEALNVRVDWDGGTRTISAGSGEVDVRLQIGKNVAYRNQTPISLDVPPQVINGRTLIPLRFFAEAFGCRVVWGSTVSEIKITSPPQEMTVTGFYALGDRQTSSWTDLFGRDYPETGAGNTGKLSTLALGWYSLDRQGNLLTESRTGWKRPQGWENVLQAAAEYGLATEMVIHVTDEGGTIHSLLTDGAAMARAVAAIAEEAKFYQGVNLDLEGLGYGDKGEELAAVREHFTAFVNLLSEQLRKTGKTLTLTLHAPNSAYKGYDYRELGKIADNIIIMAYDYGPVPEPVNLVAQAVEAAAALVPPEKLMLGISAPSETSASLPAKIGIARRYNLGGIALWRLGLISGGMWDALGDAVTARK